MENTNITNTTNDDISAAQAIAEAISCEAAAAEVTEEETFDSQTSQTDNALPVETSSHESMPLTRQDLVEALREAQRLGYEQGKAQADAQTDRQRQAESVPTFLNYIRPGFWE